MTTAEPITVRKNRVVHLGRNLAITFDRLCRLLGTPTLEEWNDNYDKYADPPCDDKLSQEENWKLEEEQRDEEWKKYEEAVMYVAEDLFDKHHLTLIPRWKTFRHGKKSTKFIKDYCIKPKTGKTWGDAADEIRTTVNGAGPFYFASLREMLNSGPYSRRELVACHLGWIPDWWAVYEGSTAKAQVQGRIRH